MGKRKTNERGITLISLVITIILLLILATVAISLAVDSDGLFSKAGDAANKWNSSVAGEDRALGNLMSMLNELNKTKTLGDVYSEDMIGQSVTYTANGQSEWIILGEDTEKEGNILITTKEPVANLYDIYGNVEKWLSYENDLHTACAIYGGEIGGVEVEARSITIEDINSVTGFDTSELEFDTYTFGTTMDFVNKKVNYLYPKEGLTWTDGDGTVWTSWKLPTAENETTFKDDLYFYNDTVYGYNQGGSGQLVTTTEHIDPAKGELIWGKEKSFRYVVASRGVWIREEGAVYGVAVVGGGMVLNGGESAYCLSSANMIRDMEDDMRDDILVRPVVSVPLNIPVAYVDGVYDFVR